MALKGDLASVDLAQVFQMLALNRKVGMLSIQSPRTWRALYFDDQGVTLYYNEHTLLDRILTNLVRSGQLLEASVQEVRRLASQEGGSLVDSLLGGGYVAEDELDAFFRTELEEDIYDLFFWKNARFEFFEGATSFEGREGVINERFTFATDTLIMEAARRIDEWAFIKERIPGAMEVYRLVSPDIVDSLDETTAAVAGLVDGKRNIAKLIETSGMAPFHVYKSVSQLLDEKVIELLPVDVLISTGEECVREARLEDAVSLFEKAIAVGEGIPEAHLLAADAYENCREYELSAYHLKCVAEYHASEGHLKQAVGTLRKVIDAIPTDLAARERLVELTVGHPEFKSDDFDPAAQGKILVDLYLEVGEIERVRGILERLLRENPTDLELKKILINVHTKAGDTRRVIELFESIAGDLVHTHNPIEAVKYLQKILMLDRSRSDISERIRSLYELDERRRSRRRSLLALGLPFCLLAILGTVYYMYDQHARAKFEALNVSGLLEENNFAAAEGVYLGFIADFPYTMVIRDAKSELARVRSQRKLYEAREDIENRAEDGRLKALRTRYQLAWIQHREQFRSGRPEQAMRTVEEVLSLVKEAGEPRDLKWAKDEKVEQTYTELHRHLGEAAALDRQGRESWEKRDWQAARASWLKLVQEYSLTSTARNAKLPVFLSSKPLGARILKDGAPLTRPGGGQVVTPAVILCEHEEAQELSLERDGFEPADVRVDAKSNPEGVFEFVLKIIPNASYEFESPVRTAAGTDGTIVAVGLSGGKVGFSRVGQRSRTTTLTLDGLNALVGEPSVSAGRIFFANNEGDLQSIVVGEAIGTDWTAKLDHPPAYRLTLRNGRVLFADMGGTLLCFDQTSGSRKLWSVPLGGEASGRPTVNGSNVFVGVKDGIVKIFKASGEPVREHRVDRRISTAIYPVGANLIFGCTDGTLRAIHQTNGRERWSLDLGRPLDESEIAVAVGAVIVRAKDNQLWRVDPETKEILAEVKLPHPFHAGPIVSGGRVFTVVRKDLGRRQNLDLLQAWQVDDLSPLWEYEDGKPFSGSVSADGTSVYLPDSGGNLLQFR